MTMLPPSMATPASVPAAQRLPRLRVADRPGGCWIGHVDSGAAPPRRPRPWRPPRWSRRPPVPAGLVLAGGAELGRATCSLPSRAEGPQVAVPVPAGRLAPGMLALGAAELHRPSRRRPKRNAGWPRRRARPAADGPQFVAGACREHRHEAVGLGRRRRRSPRVTFGDAGVRLPVRRLERRWLMAKPPVTEPAMAILPSAAMAQGHARLASAEAPRVRV